MEIKISKFLKTLRFTQCNNVMRFRCRKIASDLIEACEKMSAFSIILTGKNLIFELKNTNECNCCVSNHFQ